ncbi:MAG: F0F1 ATP synthase subunit B', partial [Hyphomicrobiales bacterium]|nr:F0F1 ATP synthase subunit B' [Hyphomicrobiales bacterium]
MAQATIAKIATTAAPGGAAGHAFPPFQFETFPSQLLWLALTFGALYLAMSKVIAPGIGATLEARRKAIADRIDEASAMQAKA